MDNQSTWKIISIVPGFVELEGDESVHAEAEVVVDNLQR